MTGDPQGQPRPVERIEPQTISDRGGLPGRQVRIPDHLARATGHQSTTFRRDAELLTRFANRPSASPGVDQVQPQTISNHSGLPGRNVQVSPRVSQGVAGQSHSQIEAKVMALHCKGTCRREEQGQTQSHAAGRSAGGGSRGR